MNAHQLPPVEAGQKMAEVFTAERQNAIEQTLREVSSGQNLRAIGGLRIYRRQGGVTIAQRRRPSGSGGGGTVPIDVCVNGAPMTRDFVAGDPY